MTPDLIVFFLLAIVAIGAALGMLLSRNAVHSALFLVLTMAVISVFFLILSAPFVAMVQITVYAGAIMVLFLFVIMLLGAEGLRRPTTALPWQPWLAGALAVLFVAALGYALFVRGGQFFSLGALAAGSAQDLPADFGGPKALGLELFKNYLLPFELTSFLLLVGMIGAVVLTRDPAGRQVSQPSSKLAMPERRP
jgi:NADH-quinone oxidoreductase subunit J